MRNVIVGSFIGFVMAAAFLAACGGGGGGTTVPLGVEDDLVALQETVDGLLVDMADAKGRLVVSGTMTPCGGSVTTPPAGWLFCDGAAVSRTEYARLFAMIGTAWGEGDGSTTFNLPDLRGRFLRGMDGGAGVDPDATFRSAPNPGGNAGDMVGSVQGHATAQPEGGDFEAASSGAHTHSSTHYRMSFFLSSPGTPNLHVMNWSSAPVTQSVATDSQGAHLHSVSGGDGETRPVNAAVWWIIKA